MAEKKARFGQTDLHFKPLFFIFGLGIAFDAQLYGDKEDGRFVIATLEVTILIVQLYFNLFINIDRDALPIKKD